MAQIKIGREFFSKIRNDYASWTWAMAREFCQNSFDSGADEVRVTVSPSSLDPANTELVVSNNGTPMTEDILVNKLLTLGGSGKNFQAGATGGFGVAKSLLYCMNLDYKIITGDLFVQGSGAEYTIEPNKVREAGTTSIVTIEGDHVEELISRFQAFAALSQWDGTFTMNGEVLQTNLKKGSRRRDLGWGVVYTNRSATNRLVVRMNGAPMFVRSCSYKGCVLIELTGESKDTLTSNRDSLRGELASELQELVTQIAVDKRSALRDQKAAYKRFMGEKLRAEAAAPKGTGVSVAELVGVDIVSELLVRSEGRACASSAGIAVQTVSAEESEVSLGHEFIMKNTTGLVTPEYYQPGELFSKYSRDLVRVWAGCLVKLHQILGHSAAFSVGFILDEENEAEFERGDYGHVYYLNPARLVSQQDRPQCRSFRARYTGAWSNRFEILSLAVHEFVHGAYNLHRHDEDYSSRLTEVTGVVFANLKEFNPVFKA